MGTHKPKPPQGGLPGTDHPALTRQVKTGERATRDYCAIIGLNQKDLENQGILA